MYRVIDEIMISGIVVDVDCDAAQGRDLAGKFIKPGVVLPVTSELNEDTDMGEWIDRPFSLVGVGHSAHRKRMEMEGRGG
jgi:hypothetical protein